MKKTHPTPKGANPQAKLNSREARHESLLGRPRADKDVSVNRKSENESRIKKTKANGRQVVMGSALAGMLTLAGCGDNERDAKNPYDQDRDRDGQAEQHEVQTSNTPEVLYSADALDSDEKKLAALESGGLNVAHAAARYLQDNGAYFTLEEDNTEASQERMLYMGASTFIANYEGSESEFLSSFDQDTRLDETGTIVEIAVVASPADMMNNDELSDKKQLWIRMATDYQAIASESPEQGKWAFAILEITDESFIPKNQAQMKDFTKLLASMDAAQLLDGGLVAYDNYDNGKKVSVNADELGTAEEVASSLNEARGGVQEILGKKLDTPLPPDAYPPTRMPKNVASKRRASPADDRAKRAPGRSRWTGPVERPPSASAAAWLRPPAVPSASATTTLW